MQHTKNYLNKITLLVLLSIMFFWRCNCENIVDDNRDIKGEDVMLKDIIFSDYSSSIQDTHNIDIWEINDITVEDTPLNEDIDLKDTFNDSEQFDYIEDITLDICQPNCLNRECGDDGCGGNCGVCGSNAICSYGKCICVEGYANCNDDYSDGCEVDLNSSNSCGTDCKNIINCGQNSICNSGVCECYEGYANCDELWNTGCEVYLNSTETCGSDCLTIVRCSTVNGSNPMCDNGICRLACDNEFADCNAKVGSSDGCEVNLNNSETCGTNCQNIKNCGQNSICLHGVCGCINGYGNCNGLRIDGCEKDLTSDSEHCGNCNNSCGANGICVNSECGCIFPYMDCNNLLSDGCEVNIDKDKNNCGGCDNLCSLLNTAVNICIDGRCKVESCISGYGNCDGEDSNGCEKNLTSDPNNCGFCGNRCGENAYCENSSCNCISGFGNCDNDWRNGCESDLLNDINHCGSCSDYCGSNSICKSGKCECLYGYGNCDSKWSNGCETEFNSIYSCGTNCSNIVRCSIENGIYSLCEKGVCYTICNGGYADCNPGIGTSDGCETNLRNIKTCGRSCSDFTDCGDNSVCNFGECACEYGYANCNSDLRDGCEVYIVSNDQNCGGCGTICGKNSHCENMSCKCNQGYADCDGDPSNGCEIDITKDPQHCGSCLINCGQNSMCSNGICGCENGYGNCDNLWGNGCEISFSSIESCGSSCSNLIGCSTKNGFSPICDNGICRLTCYDGYADCNANIGSSDGCEKLEDERHIWSKSFGGNSYEYGIGICLDSSNNIYITGYYGSPYLSFGGGFLRNNGSYDIYVAKFDNRGKHLFSNNFGGSYIDLSFSCSIDSSDNLYLVGHYESPSINFGGGDLINAGGNCGEEYPCSDIFIAKFDSNGNHLWSKRFGGDSYDLVFGSAVDLDSNLFIIGRFLSSHINFGGGDLINAGGNCVEYLCSDILLAKFDSNGNHLWSKRFGGINGDGGISISIDSYGNLYVTGCFGSSTIDFGGGTLTNAGGLDIFIAKFDGNGNHLWSKRFGGSGGDLGHSVSVDSSGNIYLTGWFTSSTIDFGGGALTNAGGGDIFLARFDSNGNHIWSKRFGGSSDNQGFSVSVDSLGNVYGTGYFVSSNIDFGGCPLSNAGWMDIYLIKFAP